jgi:electron transport complex protein RnfB
MNVNRRAFVTDGLRILGVVGLGGAATALAARQGGEARGEKYVWQIDPDKCMACGKCQENCVLDVSAVKCVQCFAMCGYCDVCTGYFVERYRSLDTVAEEQLCPTAAITRKFVEAQGNQRYFEYTINEPLCIGCGKCVKGCALMNGSLYLQVRHDRCLNCNECSIALDCPTQAFRRVPAATPNLLKENARGALAALAERRRQERGA